MRNSFSFNLSSFHLWCPFPRDLEKENGFFVSILYTIIHVASPEITFNDSQAWRWQWRKPLVVNHHDGRNTAVLSAG